MAMVRRVPFRVVLGIALFGLTMLLTGCGSAEQNPMTTIDPAGAAADQVQDIYSLIWWLAVAVFILVEGLIVFVIFRFRNRPRMSHGRPVPVHGNTKLEIVWTVIPAIILVVIAIPTMQTIATLSSSPDANVQPQIQVATQAPTQEAATSSDPVAAGKAIAESICASCHTIAGTQAQGTIGPELTHIASQPQIAGTLENTPENMKRWVDDPPAVKPGTTMPDHGLSEQQIDNVVAYLETLE